MEKLLDIAAPIIQKTYFGKDLEVLKKLEGIFEEAFEQLDEGQEIPLRRETFKDALKFLLILPNDYPIPELEIEETGDITMEWYRDKWNIFSVMVDGSGVYYYAGLFGDEDNRDKGRKPLGIVIDEVVLKHIKRIIG